MIKMRWTLTTWFLEKIQQFLLKDVNLIVCPSKYAQDIVTKKYKINKNKTIILHNGITKKE